MLAGRMTLEKDIERIRMTSDYTGSTVGLQGEIVEAALNDRGCTVKSSW